MDGLLGVRQSHRSMDACMNAVYSLVDFGLDRAEVIRVSCLFDQPALHIPCGSMNIWSLCHLPPMKDHWAVVSSPRVEHGIISQLWLGIQWLCACVCVRMCMCVYMYVCV